MSLFLSFYRYIEAFLECNQVELDEDEEGRRRLEGDDEMEM